MEKGKSGHRCRRRDEAGKASFLRPLAETRRTGLPLTIHAARSTGRSWPAATLNDSDNVAILIEYRRSAVLRHPTIKVKFKNN
jgi:hypothetical protein